MKKQAKGKGYLSKKETLLNKQDSHNLNMEIKNNISNLLPKTETNRLLPKLNSFDNHFILADNILKPELLNQAEIQWKQIENFEFQKMDVNASFEQLIKRI